MTDDITKLLAALDLVNQAYDFMPPAETAHLRRIIRYCLSDLDDHGYYRAKLVRLG